MKGLTGVGGEGHLFWTCADLVIHLLELRAVSVGHPKHAKQFKKDLPACHPGPSDFKARHGANVSSFCVLALFVIVLLPFVKLFMIVT